MIMVAHVLHHSKVRSSFSEKSKHYPLDKLIAVGDLMNAHNHVELFTLSRSKWKIKKDYPYSKDISYYSILPVQKTFIIFGGYSYKNYGSKLQSTIARFDAIKNSWTKLGNLRVSRYAHGVIQVDNEFIVVGGRISNFNAVPTESCKLNGQSITCTTTVPELSKFSYYPELMIIR